MDGEAGRIQNAAREIFALQVIWIVIFSLALWIWDESHRGSSQLLSEYFLSSFVGGPSSDDGMVKILRYRLRFYMETRFFNLANREIGATMKIGGLSSRFCNLLADFPQLSFIQIFVARHR